MNPEGVVSSGEHFRFAKRTSINSLLGTHITEEAVSLRWLMRDSSKRLSDQYTLRIGDAPLFIGSRTLTTGEVEFIGVLKHPMTTVPLSAFLHHNRIARETPVSLSGMLADFDLPILPGVAQKKRYDAHAKHLKGAWGEFMTFLPSMYAVLVQGKISSLLETMVTYEGAIHDLLSWATSAVTLSTGKEYLLIPGVSSVTPHLERRESPLATRMLAERAFKTLPKEIRQEAVLSAMQYIGFVISPREVKSFAPEQHIRGIDISYAGNDAIHIQIGDTYHAVARRRKNTKSYFNGDVYSIVSSSVEAANNVIYPVLRWRLAGGVRTFDMTPLGQEDGVRLQQLLKVKTQRPGDVLDATQWNLSVGTSVIPYVYPELRSLWKMERGYTEKNSVMSSHGWGDTNTMGAVQACVVHLQEKETLAQMPLFQKMEEHAAL